MPYRIEKQGSKYVVINKDTGKVKSHHDTREKAHASVNAALAGEHGWKPTHDK